MSQPDNGARVGPGAIAVIAAAALTLGALSLFSGLPALAALIAFAVIAAVALYACKREPSRRDITAEGPGSEATAMTQAVAVIGEGLPDPAIAVDRGKAVIFANALALDAFPTIRPGQPISTGLRSPAVLEALVTVLETGQNARVELKEHVPVERHFEIHLAAIPEDMGNTQGSRGVHAVLMVIRDLTQQERVERMRADFVTNVSHELRTPLASVIGLIETLQGPAREDKKARAEFLELIRLQAGRMSRLINDLLSLSRIEMQAHVRPRDEVDLSQTIMHVIDVLRPVADDAGVTLSAEGFDEPVIVQGARDELIQVFQNLIENAIKYGESGKKVVVSRTAPEDQDTGGEAARTAIEVRDFGPGIAREHVPRLTERFYRVDAGSSREKGGTGLGLAIVKHILNRHDARLRIKSAVNEGSSFLVEFPVSAHRAAAQTSPEVFGASRKEPVQTRATE